jgi:hypothetical protein
MNFLRTEVADLHLDDDGILHVRMHKGAQLTEEHAARHFEDCRFLLKGRKALVLVDGREKYSTTSDARRFIAARSARENRVAIAYICKGVLDKLAFWFYKKINKPVVPTRMFRTEAAGMRWLKSFVVMPGDEFIKK